MRTRSFPHYIPYGIFGSPCVARPVFRVQLHKTRRRWNSGARYRSFRVSASRVRRATGDSKVPLVYKRRVRPSAAASMDLAEAGDRGPRLRAGQMALAGYETFQARKEVSVASYGVAAMAFSEHPVDDGSRSHNIQPYRTIHRCNGVRAMLVYTETLLNVHK